MESLMEGVESAAGRVGLEMPWPCWIEVDLDALGHNVRGIGGLVGPGCQVMAVVKAQAYGHGAEVVARWALEAGATWLAVARVREAVQLQRVGLEAPILLLGPMGDAEAPLVVDGQIRPTVVSVEQARTLSEAAETSGQTVPVHVKVDTGLGRYGAPLEEVRRLVERMALLPGLRLEGLYSHFATADEPEGSYAAAQLEAFHAARAALKSDGFDPPLVHMAASAGLLALGESHLNLVRAGLSLYGLYPSPHLAGRLDLRPALALHARVARTFRLEAGQSVGYGRTYVARGSVEAALVPVGYAEGLPRSHSNRGCALVKGRRAPIIGRVSMDQSVVDITACGPVAVGDPVVLIGGQEADRITAEEFAATSGTIGYEVLTSLGYRIPRVYRSGGAVVAVAYLDEGRVEYFTA